MQLSLTFLILLIQLLVSPVRAATNSSIDVCYNFGCSKHAKVSFNTEQLNNIQTILSQARDANSERNAIARSIAQLYTWAGQQTPIHADHAGNWLDQGIEGRMDCIDHSTTTDRFLHLIQEQGWLHFHHVLPVAVRHTMIFQHFSAAIEENGSPKFEVKAPPPAKEIRNSLQVRADGTVVVVFANGTSREYDREIDGPLHTLAPAQQSRPNRVEASTQFVVDSWFVNNGEPPIIIPLQEWRHGGGPNVM